MKVTTEKDEKVILSRIDFISLLFEDGKEIVLDDIVEYDIDLDISTYSTLDLSSAYFSTELQNHILSNKSNEINFIHIEAETITSKAEVTKMLYDIPCHMHIRRLLIDSVTNNMRIVLEGGFS